MYKKIVPANNNQLMSQQRPKISTSFSYETLEETLDIKPKGARLQIGIPKEIAFQENRIALTPDAVKIGRASCRERV